MILNTTSHTVQRTKPVYIQNQIANREKILAISTSNVDIDFLILAISISNIDIDFLNTTSHTVQRTKASIYIQNQIVNTEKILAISISNSYRHYQGFAQSAAPRRSAALLN